MSQRRTSETGSPNRYYGPGVLTRHTHTTVEYGIGTFQHASNDPEELDDIWTTLAEPELERRHRARQEPVETASLSSFYWSLAGIGGMAAGIVPAALIQDDRPTAAAVFGLTGLAVGLLGVVGVIASLPSGEEMQNFYARRRLFVPGEDDISAAARGVERANARRRRECGDSAAAPDGAQPD